MSELLIYCGVMAVGIVVYALWAWAISAISKVPLKKVLKFWEW